MLKLQVFFIQGLTNRSQESTLPESAGGTGTDGLYQPRWPAAKTSTEKERSQMQTRINITPTPNSEATTNVTTLKDIGRVGTTRVQHNALLGINLGNNTLISAIPM